MPFLVIETSAGDKLQLVRQNVPGSFEECRSILIEPTAEFSVEVRHTKNLRGARSGGVLQGPEECSQNDGLPIERGRCDPILVLGIESHIEQTSREVQRTLEAGLE